MRQLEATGEYTTAEINKMVRGGKYRGHIPGVGQTLPGYVASRPSSAAPPDKTEFLWNMLRSDDRYADAFAQWGGSGGAGTSRACDDDDGEDGEGGDDTRREDGDDDTS